MFTVIWDVTDPDWIERFETEAEMHQACLDRMSIENVDPTDTQYLKWRETHNPPPIAVFESVEDPIDEWKNVRPFAIYLDGKRWNCTEADLDR